MTYPYPGCLEPVYSVPRCRFSRRGSIIKTVLRKFNSIQQYGIAAFAILITRDTD